MKAWNIFILLLFMISCTSETQIDVPKPEDKNKNLTLKVLIPGTATPQSYGLDNEIIENTITTIDVLVFKKGSPDNEANEIFTQRATVTSGFTNGGLNNNRKTFDIILSLQSEPGRLIILANAKDILDGAGLVENTTTKGNLIKKLIYDAESFKPTLISSSFKGFPMWGQSATFVDLSTTTPSNIDDIYLLRTTARVDITNPLSDSDFKINNIRVYYAKKKGFITPSGDLTIAATTKVSATNIPTTSDDASQGEFRIDQPYIAGGIEREIYVGENDKKGTTSTPTFIVLEAQYKGGGNSYYRLDFVKDNSYLPVFRNHKYLFQILGVSADGFGSWDLAAASDIPSAGIVVNLTVDSENNQPIHEMVYNNQYMLGVSVSEVLFDWDQPWIGKSYADANYYNLRVLTTNTNGWTATKNASASWITFVNGGGTDISGNQTTGTMATETLRFRVNGNNTTGVERSEIITLKAGDLVITLKVRQSGGANCHVVRFKSGETTAKVQIPLAFAKEARGLSLPTDKLGPKVLWREVTESTPVAFTAEMKGSGDSRYIEVTATSYSSYYGNAVVALVSGDGIGMVGGTNSEEVFWSWHVWSMPEDTDIDNSFHDPNKDIFMRSVMGRYASNNGMFYQWGRKDPFPSSALHISPRVMSIEEVSIANTVEYAIQNPTTLYKGSDWLLSGRTDLWNTQKTYYDPCPTGWHVPDKSYASSWTLNTTFADYQNGFWDASTGTYLTLNPLLWTANTGESNPDHASFYISLESSGKVANASWETSKASGYSVRCVKDIQLVKGM